MKKIQRGCPPYEGADPYLYFCFAEKDREAVFPLLEYLYLRGVRIWYNVENTADIKKLNRQQERMNQAIGRMNAAWDRLNTVWDGAIKVSFMAEWVTLMG